MDIEDDDAFLYGESTPPPEPSIAEVKPEQKVETDSKPNVQTTRSSFPLPLGYT
jgi:hypothetical protein